MRAEDIDYLIRNNIPVTKYTLDHMDLFDSARSTLRSDLNMGPIPLDIKGIGSIYDYVANLFKKGITSREKIRGGVLKLREDTAGRVANINKALDELRNEVAASAVLEKSMSGQVKTVAITFQDESILSDESEGITFANQRIYADPKGQKPVKAAVRVETYPYDSLSATMRSKTRIEEAKLEGVTQEGTGYVPSPDEMIINNDTPFRIEATADAEREVKLDLLIDRKDSSVFNKIEMSLEVAHMVTIHTSSDGNEYVSPVERPMYIYDSFIQIAPTTHRFIKIVFHKNKPDTVRNGNDIFLTTIRSLSLIRTTFTGESKFISTGIKIEGAYSKIALTVCDSTSLGHNSLVDYSLSINGQQWQEIRPISRTTGDTPTKPSVINVNKLVDNRSMILDESTTIDGITEYSLLLPEDFIRSNQMRIFGKNITDTPEEWRYERGIHTAIGILYTERTMDFGTEEVFINGRWVSGEITLAPDIYRLGVSASSYANVILNRTGKVTDLGNGEFAVESTTGAVHTVFDPLYPYNHKNILETKFDYILRKELIENVDYNIYNSGNGYQVKTYQDNGLLLAAYRLYEANVKTIQLKAELRSGDNVTIPSIEKIIIRLA